MANNSDTRHSPVDDDEFGSGAAVTGRDFDRPSDTPFGDPGQHLYGGRWQGSPSHNVPLASAESPYEGRHRAAD